MQSTVWNGNVRYHSADTLNSNSDSNKLNKGLHRPRHCVVAWLPWRVRACSPHHRASHLTWVPQAEWQQPHPTLQPQPQLPPYQQPVMPQKPVISGPPPRAVEEAQKIAQAATIQAVRSVVPMGMQARTVQHPQQGFQQQQPPNMATTSGPMAPPMMRQQNPGLQSQNIEQSLPQAIPPQAMGPQNMPSSIQQTMPPPMQHTTGAPGNTGIPPAALEWYQKQQQMNRSNAMMAGAQQTVPSKCSLDNKVPLLLGRNRVDQICQFLCSNCCNA